MSKKHNKPQPEPVSETQSAAAPGRPAVQTPVQPSAGQPPVSKAQIWTFWGGVAAALVAAQALAYLLPGVPERVIERWVMLAFAAFVGVFLFKLK